MFHSRGSNERINKIHERALRAVHYDYFSTFEELLIKDNCVTIHHRNLQVLATNIFKAVNDLSPPILKKSVKSKPYNLTSAMLKTRNIKTVSYDIETLAQRPQGMDNGS